MGYVECHCHLLPFVDDGVKTKDQALSVVASYKEAGFDTIVTTPHLYNPQVATQVNHIRGMYNWLKGECSRIGIDLILGSETYVGSSYSPKNIPFLGNFVLVEVDALVEPLFLLNYAYTLIKNGHYVILAHVERYNWFSETSVVMNKLRDMGVFFQSNSDAVLDGKVDSYIEKNLIDIIAGDNHGDIKIPGQLAACMQLHPTILQNMNRLFNK
ncbi:MAG: hypothetical protein EOM67_09430 [Spirochaetia bacterium]|nr:hypothetical protein [Spirochaetia bacterium]